MGSEPPIPLLLPCPFCGGSVRIASKAICCDTCHYTIECWGLLDMRKKWNTRANLTPDTLLLQKIGALADNYLDDTSLTQGYLRALSDCTRVIQQHPSPDRDGLIETLEAYKQQHNQGDMPMDPANFYINGCIAIVREHEAGKFMEDASTRKDEAAQALKSSPTSHVADVSKMVSSESPDAAKRIAKIIVEKVSGHFRFDSDHLLYVDVAEAILADIHQSESTVVDQLKNMLHLVPTKDLWDKVSDLLTWAREEIGRGDGTSGFDPQSASETRGKLAEAGSTPALPASRGCESSVMEVPSTKRLDMGSAPASANQRRETSDVFLHDEVLFPISEEMGPETDDGYHFGKRMVEIGAAIKAIRPYLRTREPDKCPDCGADMIEVCSGLESMCREQKPVTGAVSVPGDIWYGCATGCKMVNQQAAKEQPVQESDDEYSTVYEAIWGAYFPGKIKWCDEATKAVLSKLRLPKRESVDLFKIGSDLNAWADHVQGLNGWQPIETAPKDGRIIMYSGKKNLEGERVTVGLWGEYCVSNYPKFSHWMPLPQPPDDQGRRG